MYADGVASSSRLPLQENWDPPSSLWTFPVSDCRYEPSLPDALTSSTSEALHQSTAKSSAHASTSTTPPSHPINLPIRSQLSPGVWTDGGRKIYSSALPEVQQLLETARSTLTLPDISSDLIFTLAALDVFYKPGDPVHWLFWSDEKKESTANVVTRISFAWNGTPEYLSILAIHHGSTWRQLYESKPWFTTVAPPKPSPQARQLNLRKRKVAPGAFRDLSKSPGLEDEGDEPVRAASPELGEDTGPPTKPSDKRKTRAARKTKPLPPPSPLSSATNSPEPAVLTLSPEQDPAGLSADVDPPTVETATRSKRKISAPSRYPQSVSYLQQVPPALEGSLLLGPGQPVEPIISGHTRTRSTSTDSSAKTAVASDVSRSASVASGTTAVDARGDASPSKKRKSLDDDADELEDVHLQNLDLADPDEEGGDDDEDSVTTHGRGKRTRKPIINDTLDDAIFEKTKSARNGSSARTNRKRARKA
ncbi:hypothetical protein EST38_g4211 [Candolleomyces aberdarensis]|uniref:Uncharacterized protein n=1 Tax=Candolleomyces aberdarensis TaxID=2316362 RepID=A0A4Q2DQ93_9AGAR|nr:hypothetical protein EST38_g4211 [Candolleomyces aberdarensis]